MKTNTASTSSSNKPTLLDSVSSNAMFGAQSPGALRDRIASIFGVEVKIETYPEGRTCGPFLDAMLSDTPNLDPSFVVKCDSKTKLVAIVTPDTCTEAINKLPKLNPWLNETVQTWWNHSIFFWMRVDGRCPANRELLDCIWWLTDTPVPVHPVSGKHYRPDMFPLNGSEIKTVRFEQIKWPNITISHNLFPTFPAFYRPRLH